MVQVPTWEQHVSDLPGGSNIPHATPDTFGAQKGRALEAMGHQIASAMEKFGSALSSQQNEQNAISAKVAVADHETAVNLENLRLQSTTPSSEAATIPDRVHQFATDDWQQRSESLAPKYRDIAGAQVRGFHGRLYIHNQQTAIKGYLDSVKTQIGSKVDQIGQQVFADPDTRVAGAATISALVHETSLTPEVKRVLLEEAGTKMVTQIYAGYDNRALQAYQRGLMQTGDEILAQKEFLRKTLGAEVHKLLGIETLPKPVTPSILKPNAAPPQRLNMSLSQRRISAIDATPVGAMIDEAAARYNISPAVAKVIAHVESGGRANVTTGSYGGIFQLSKDEMARYGTGGNRYDAQANVEAGVRSLADKAARFERETGRSPSAVELYMTHQQGEAGTRNHLANPDGLAWENMLATGEGRRKGAGWAKKAVWGNIPTDMRKLFPGGVNDVTSRDLVKIWSLKMAGKRTMTDLEYE